MSSATARLVAPALPHPRRVLAAGALAIGLGLAVALDSRTAALITAAVVAPALVWADPRIAFGLLAVTLGLNVDIIEAPVHVSLPQLVAIAMVGSVLVHGRPRPSEGSGSLWTRAGFLFVLTALPSLIRVPSMSAAISGLLQFLVLAIVLAAAVRLLIDQRVDLESMIGLVVLGALLSLVPAFVQVIAGIGPVEYRLDGVMRAYSTYRQPNSYGAYLVGVLPIALAQAFARRRPFDVAAAMAIAVGIALTGSRGTWAGAIVALFVFLMITFRPRLSTIAGAVAVLGITVTAILLLPESFVTGRLDLSDWSSQQRMLTLLTAVDGVLRNPILGYGPGAFEQLLPEIARAGLTDDVRMPHNLFLHVWFELGLAALLCLIILIGGYYRAAVRAYRRSRDVRLAGLIGGVTAMLAAAMFGTLFIRGVAEMFVLLVALSAATVHMLQPVSPVPGIARAGRD